TYALNTYLDVDDWNSASRHLLTFAMQKTPSEIGFLAVKLASSVLRVLGPDGAVWDLLVDRPPAQHSDVCQASQIYFERAHIKDSLKKVLSTGKTYFTNPPYEDLNLGRDPASGDTLVKSFFGVPILKEKETVGLLVLC